MTTIYFIRHAEADNTNRDGRNRPLTAKGFADCKLVTEFLKGKNIDAVLSSPFKRAVDTVADFTGKNGFEMEIIEDFREQKSSKGMGKDNPNHYQFLEQQWVDFSYKLSEGECLSEVQERNISALNEVLTRYKDKTIAIGTHGTALSTIINYYDSTYGFKDFMAMVNILPWVVRMDFNDDGCICIEKIDLFNSVTTLDHNQCKPCIVDLGALKAYKFTVIFARYQDKWLYCRAKERDCYETAGGHVEDGETPLEAAKRELYEETGALKFDITPAFDYSIHYPNIYTTGQVYFAQIHRLGKIPDFEMAEIRLFDTIPDKMRFPQILPVLFEKMQKWLGIQLFICPKCKFKLILPICGQCGYEVKSINNIWQLSDMPDIVTDGDGDKYIGYEYIGENYSGNRKYVIEERDLLFAKEIAKLTKNGVFLDLACGDGCFTVPCASHGVKIIAGDISNAMLGILQKKALHNNISLGNVILCRLNALDIPVADESVDTVVANSVLHLISNPEKVIAEIYRALKKGGAFICKDDTPGRTAQTNFDNNQYNEIVNSLYSEYWRNLKEYDITPKKYSWKFDRNSCCDSLFAEKSTIFIEKGNAYESSLKEGFLARFTGRGFSDQVVVPQDIHERVLEKLLHDFRQRYGDDFTDVTFKGVEEDILITVYRK